MKIAWFTPFPKKSAIGKYSLIITNELIKHFKVDLWLSEKETELLPTELKVYHYQLNEKWLRKLCKYDFVVYNLGNHLYFHKDIYEVSKQIPGFVILHDFVMHHFFAGYYLEQKQDPGGYIQDMKQLYEENGRKIAIDSINGTCTPIWETEEVMQYPLFEKAIEGANGIIVHSHYLAQKVKQRFLGPVGVIYHPYTFEKSIAHGKVKKTDLGMPKDKIIMVTLGHVNPNKRIDKVIEVLGKDKDLASKIIYLIIGPHEHIQYFSYLQSLVKKYDLQGSVKFLGFQADSILYAYMQHADIFVNLRFPAMEGASWSLVEQLYFGKPVMVTDTGFYSELPNDCVMKIRIDAEKNDIYKTLKKLVNDVKMREKIGTKGRKFAEEHFTVHKYCHKFFEFLKKVEHFKPVLGLIDTAGRELASMGVSGDMEVVDAVSQEIYNMFKEGH